MAPPTLARRLQSLPPMLHKLPLGSMSNCSKAPRGLFVLMRTDGIFTANALSPSPFLRQYPYHYSIRAGQNLPDKEFRSIANICCYLYTYFQIGAIQFLAQSLCRHRVRTISFPTGIWHVVSEGFKSLFFVDSFLMLVFLCYQYLPSSNAPSETLVLKPV